MVFMRLLAGLLDDEVDGLVALLVFAVDIVLTGHDGIEDDTDDGADRQTRQADGAERQRAGGGVADADGEDQDQSRDKDVSGLRKVDLVFNNVPDAEIIP